MRSGFFAQIETLAGLLKFHLITLEYVFTNACIIDYNISREALKESAINQSEFVFRRGQEIVVQYNIEIAGIQ